MKIIVFNPGSQGGIVKYAWEQSAALRRLGVAVIVLHDRAQTAASAMVFENEAVLVGEQQQRHARTKLSRGLFLIRQCLGDQVALFRAVIRHRPDAILLSSYTEYLSPLWVWLQLCAANLFKVTFVAVLHDPVRNFVVGPLWWHKLSVRMAYWPLSAVFVHQIPPLEAEIPSEVRVLAVPHGLFPVVRSSDSRGALRSLWGIPDEGVVFLSFGFIRDSKNLDLLIRVLPYIPNSYLVVAGRVQSESVNKPVAFYEKLVRVLGVSQRVKFFVKFIPDEEIVGYLEAADVFALTYGTSFRSQSGVLNTVAHLDKPLLASCGPGPLKESVEKFGLGYFVPPDDLPALVQGVEKTCSLVEMLRKNERLPDGYPKLDWDGYRETASWICNAETVLSAVRAVRSERKTR